MALDLKTSFPRSPFDEIDGYPWLPRLIDKARAYYAGSLGDYSPYPCPGDKNFLKALGLDAAPLGALIQSGARDEEIAAWVRQHAKGDGLAAYKRGLYEKPTDLFGRLLAWGFKKSKIKRLREQNPGFNFTTLDTLPKILALEEGHPVPGA